MMQSIIAILRQLQPIITLAALLFGVLAAWKGLGELIPILNQIVAVKGDAQRYAVIAGALALVGGRA